MRAARKLFGLCCIVAAAGFFAAGQANAGISCHKINAKGVGQDLGSGNTEAQIIGGGLLHGTTQAHFDITGGSFPVFAIDGTLHITTNQATVTVHLVGSFNVATGAFLSTGPVIGATGKLAGATGTLSLDGVEDLASGKFTEDISGTICVNLAP
ncbi:MAG TPA: hypothetical protein VFJ48_12445 [Casimicrobiaceae bacterium]|nr:hypothetical protein [Casimicrobiaceae bacterium]